MIAALDVSILSAIAVSDENVVKKRDPSALQSQ